MPEIVIGGKKLPRVESISLSLGLGEADANQIPSTSCTFVIPADNDITLVTWVLAPQGDARYKKVEVSTHDRSGTLNKTWTFAKAYIANYSETESGEGMTTSTTVTIVGTLLHATQNYDGKNVLEVKQGKTEANPT